MVIGPSPGMVEHQKRWHTATCTITRPGAGDPVFDPETGEYTDPPASTVLAGEACLVTPEGGDRVQQFGEGPVVTRTYMVTIGDTSTAIKVGDTVTIDTSRDAQLTGLALVVLDIPKSEMVTVRRLTVEEVL